MKVTLSGSHLGARVDAASLRRFENAIGVDAVFAIDFIDAAIAALERARATVHWAGPNTSPPPASLPK